MSGDQYAVVAQWLRDGGWEPCEACDPVCRDCAVAEVHAIASGERFASSLLDMGMTVEGFELSIASRAAGFFASCFYDLLAEHAAENYVSMRVGLPGRPEMFVTVQRCDGITPAENAARLQIIVDELRSLWEERCSGDNKHPAVMVLDGDRFRRWFEGEEARRG